MIDKCPGGAAGGDDLQRSLLVEPVDPVVDAVAAVGVDAGQVVAGELVQPLGHQVEALVVDQRGRIRLERGVRKHQRNNVVELVELGDAEAVGELAHHLDALHVLLEPDRHGLTLKLLELVARNAVHLRQRLAEEADRVVHELLNRPRRLLGCHG